MSLFWATVFDWAYFEQLKGPLIKKEIATHEDVDLLKADVDEFDEIAMHYENVIPELAYNYGTK